MVTAKPKEDPFTNQEDNVTPIKQVEATAETNGQQVRVTLKSGSGYDVPWITLDYPDVETAFENLTDELTQAQIDGIFEAVAEAGSKFIKKFSAVAPTPPAGGGGGRPAAAGKEPPAGTAPAPGPDWTYKEGFSKSGKPWKAWMPPRGSNDSPVWL